MGEHTGKPRVAGDKGRSPLGELIHAAVRGAIEAAVEAELAAPLGAATSATTAGRAIATGRRRGR